MAARIESVSLSVEAVLAEPRRLRVPFFQRGYAWQPEHAERLLSDLSAHAAGERQLDWYPLGAIILAQASGATEAAVADGHQRLITLTILLAVLRDLENDPKRRQRLAQCILDDDGRPRFSTLPGAADMLLEAVQADGATRREPEERDPGSSPSETAILDNRSLFHARLAGLPATQRSALADFILSRTFLVVVTVADERAARLLFTTMHETGVRPRNADFLKSRVLGKCEGELREKAQDTWESIEARVGRDGMDALFLNIAAIESRTIVTEHPVVALGQIFDFDAPGVAEHFVTGRLKPIGRYYADMLQLIRDPQASPPAVFRRLQYLSWIVRHETWRLPVLHWLHSRGFEDEHTAGLLARIEALAWMNTIRAEESYRRDRRYLAILERIDRGDVLEPGGPLDISPAEWSSARQILCGPNLARRPYKLFLLLRLNSIYEGDAAVTITPDATMEHILPQRPAATGRWAQDFDGEADAAVLKHMLGNLTLLTEPEQNRAGNREFEAKRSVYGSSAFTLSRQLAGWESWTADAIRARTVQLADDLLGALGAE